MSAADAPTRRAVLAGGGALLVAAAPPPAAEVRTAAGTFIGERAGGIAAFRGIRYGRAARFRGPTAEPPATAPVRALAYGPGSPQPGGRADGTPTDEDCLFLNVWTPDARPGARLPVLVYIHGGAYSGGSGSSPLYDGTVLAGRGAVVVTLNHRLNAFGYLYLARLDSRFPDSGNTGQLDLVLALQWIRANIGNFGGDPKRVTLFGQSGGGAKIATLMATPAAAGLFHRAWTMSGQQVTASGPLHATDRARALMAKLGTTRVDDLVAMPAARLVEGLAATDPFLGGGVYMGPVLDMRTLDRHPFWPDAAPLGRGIPLVLGNTRDETRGFTPPGSPRLAGLDWTNLPDRIAPELRIDVLPEWVVAEYRRQYPQWTPTEVFHAATTAGRSWRGQVIEAEARADAGVPAHVYQLDFASRTDPRRGAFHTMDIPLAFGTLGAPGSETGTAADARAASATIQAALLSLARTGDPNGAGVPRWPRYDRRRRATLIVDTRSRIEDDPRRWQRELFARIPYIQPGT